MTVLHMVLKIVAGILLLAFLAALTWIGTHLEQIKSKIVGMGALPREAVRGNVLVLIVAVVAGILGLLLYALLS
jgi:TRAP-type C4-dicarboxylate transport system permease small subunit